MRHVVMFSGGIASWATARRVAERHGSDDLVLVYTDTNQESDGLKTFLTAAAEDVRGEFIHIDNGGRDPWDAMVEAKFLGSAFLAVCSRILKQEPARKWLKENCEPSATTTYVGMDASEGDRVKRVKAEYAKRGWVAEMPLAEWTPRVLFKQELVAMADARGLPVSPVYRDPLTMHDNCDGLCVRMGRGGWLRVLQTRRERYLYAERKEQWVIDQIAHVEPIAILRDRRGGITRPQTLRELRMEAEDMGPLFIAQHADPADMDCGGCFTLPMDEE